MRIRATLIVDLPGGRHRLTSDPSSASGQKAQKCELRKSAEELPCPARSNQAREFA
jgi:hypothetical protein